MSVNESSCEHRWPPWDGRFAMPSNLRCERCGMTAGAAKHPCTFEGYWEKHPEARPREVS